MHPFNLCCYSPIVDKLTISYLSMQHPFFNAGQRRAKMYKTCVRSTSAVIAQLWTSSQSVTCQCNTPFLTQGSSLKNDKTCIRSTSAVIAQLWTSSQSVTCQCNTPFLTQGSSLKNDKTCIRSTSAVIAQLWTSSQSVTCRSNTPFLTQGSGEQKCTKRASVQPLLL